MRSTFRGFVAAGFLVFAAGCSGGGGGGSASPTVPSQSGTGSRGTLTFSIAVPGRVPSSRAHRRLPAYVSASTTQVSVVVQGATETAPEAAQTFPCTTLCAGSISAPAGADRVTLTLEDASSKALSTGVTTVLVFAAQANTLSFVLDGVATSVDVSVSTSTLPVVPAQTGYVIFNARDVDGNVITYDGHYADANDVPLVFDLTSSNAAFALGITTVSAPGTLIPFTYDGTAHVGTITLTPSAHAGVTTTATFTPASVKLVPGIAQQINPPQQIQVVGVQQIPFPTSSLAFDSGANLIVGNGAAGAAILKYVPSSGLYNTASLQPTGGIAAVPFVAGPASPSGLTTSGYADTGNKLFAPYSEKVSSLSHGVAAASPCAGANDIPLGPYINGGPAANVYCYSASLGIQGDFIYTGAFVPAAAGTPTKIFQFGTQTVIQTVDPLGVKVWVANVVQPNVTTFGSDVVTASFFAGESDGSVHLFGNPTAIVTFSHPVNLVVGNSPAIYVMEGNSFGYVASSGGVISETGPLPIGPPAELLVGPGGVPVIVEQNGRLDVMAI